MTDVATALADKGIRLNAYGDGRHRAVCPQCSASRKKSRDPCLSVLIEDAGRMVAWTCQHCGWQSGLKVGERSLRSAAPSRAYTRPAAVKAAPTAPAAEIQMAAWFAGRGIGDETLAQFRIRRAVAYFPQISKERPCIAFPYFVDGGLVNVKYRAKVEAEDGSEDKIFAQEKGAQPTLYNADAIAEDELLFVEGEMDVLACWEAGLRSVVTLPVGAGMTLEQNTGARLTAIEAHAAKLERVKTVVIGTDADQPGDMLAEALALRFGKDRCSRIAWPDGAKDANEVLMRDGKEALRALVAAAKPYPVDGIYRASAFADDVWKLYRGEAAKPISTGIPALDRYWRIAPGSFNLISGAPNSGKSQLLAQIMVDVAQAQGWKFAWFSPEHVPARRIARLAEVLMGKPFDPGPTPRLEEADLQTAIGWVEDRFAFIESREAAPTPDWLIERARWATLRWGVNAVVIDPYNEIEASRARDRTETEFVSETIGKFKRFAAAHGCTIFMVAHPTKLRRLDNGKYPVPSLYDVAASAHFANKCDAGIVVHRDFAAERTEVYVRKIREQPAHGSIGVAALRFDPKTRRYEGVPTDDAAPEEGV